jgi:hypothetical protein
MCLTAAVAGAVQLVMRLFSFTDRMLQGLQLTCFSSVWRFIKAVGDSLCWYFVVLTDFFGARVASICSGFGSVLAKVKVIIQLSQFCFEANLSQILFWGKAISKIVLSCMQLYLF